MDAERKAKKTGRKMLPTVGTERASAQAETAFVSDAAYDANLRANAADEGDLAMQIARDYPAWAKQARSAGAAVRAGVLVRAMRTAAGLSQTSVEDASKIKQSEISAIETGAGEKGPTYDVLSRIADACGFELTFTPKAAAEHAAAPPVEFDRNRAVMGYFKGPRRKASLGGNVAVEARARPALTQIGFGKAGFARGQVVIDPDGSVVIKDAPTRKSRGRGFGFAPATFVFHDVTGKIYEVSSVQPGGLRVQGAADAPTPAGGRAKARARPIERSS
ncbi:MAG TPA: helix-turn-helix transcriptional regulator [Rhizomicrobium sp.]